MKPDPSIFASPLLCTVSLVLAGTLACASTQGQTRTGGPSPELIALDAPKAYEAPGTAPIPGLSQVIRVGRTVMTSALLPVDSLGGLVGHGDLNAQVEQAFLNLQRVLGSAGARPSEVVRITIYVVGLTADKVTLIQAAARPFFGPRPPTGAFLGVSSLAVDGALIGVEAVAETAGLLPDRNAARQAERRRPEL